MRLFKYEGYKINISEEAFALKPFKLIWNRDRSVNKDRAMPELGYIYFMEDPRSDYQIYIDPEQRAKEIREGEGLDPKWKPDKLVLEAQELYKKFLPMSALLLQDTRAAVDKLRKKLRDIDLDALDDKGKPLYTLNTITATIKMVPELVKSLSEAERAIAREIVQDEAVRGASEKSMYEDL